MNAESNSDNQPNKEYAIETILPVGILRCNEEQLMY